MKLLIVGSDEVYAIENFYVKYLREAGVEVELYTAQKYFYQYYQKSLLNKLIYRAGMSGILQQINKELKQEVAVFQPDILWVFKGMEVFPSTLHWAKERGAKLVNFNADSPFLFSGRGSGNRNVTENISLYDLHLGYSRPILAQLEKQFGKPTTLLPFGYDISAAVMGDAKAQEEVMRVCFLGNPDEMRGPFLQALADAGIPLDLYGNRWVKYVNGPNVRVHAPVYGAEAWKVLRRYRVQLNLMRPHNPDTHNMRSFELGGVGAIQLAPDTPDHRQYFEVDKEIFLYRTLDECVGAAKHLLALGQPAADRIRDAAHRRSLNGGYNYHHRAMQALAAMEELLG
jgi:spore maturation protein CgeB